MLNVKGFKKKKCVHSFFVYIQQYLTFRHCAKCLPPQAPARCVQHSADYKRHPRLVVDVCRGASSVAPAECLDLLPRAVSHETAVSLCSRVQTVGPAVCASAPGQLSHGSELTARLCHAANGQGPAECFKRSMLFTRLSIDDRIELCRGATSDAPAR